MVAHTRSSAARRRNGAAWGSLVLGVAAVAAIPLAVLLATRLDDVELIHSAAAVPVAAILGVAALLSGRRGRRRFQLTLGRAGGERAAWAGRTLGLLGLYLAVTAALALAFFGLLVLLE